MRYKLKELKQNKGYIAVTDTESQVPVIKTFSAKKEDVTNFIDKVKIFDKADKELKNAEKRLKPLP